MNLVFHISEDGSEIESKHCTSSQTSVKSSQKYFVHLNWTRLATNPSWLASIAQLVKRRSRHRRMRVRIPLKTTNFSSFFAASVNMNLVFHISEDGSEIIIAVNSHCEWVKRDLGSQSAESGNSVLLFYSTFSAV